MHSNDFWAKGDKPDKVFKDSVEAIEKNRDHMTKEQIKIAETQMKVGLKPDGYNQLCDRRASKNFQG